jgi:hypothetical protein
MKSHRTDIAVTLFAATLFIALPAFPLQAASPGIVDAAQYSTLQAALDAVPEEGGLVRLPPAEFELLSPLILTRENTRIEGAGAATHLINRNEEGQPALIIRPKDYPRDQRARIWRVQLADLRISGNPKSGDGVRTEAADEIYVHGLSVDHNGGHGVNLIDCYEDPRIADSILTYNGGAGLNILAGHDIVVNGNQFEENQDAVRCIDSFNLCMNGNNLDDHLRHGVVVENTYGSVVSGNMIEECAGTAIVLDRDCYGVTISANVIAHESGGGVDLRDAWGCAVSANTFTIVAQRALAIGPNSGRITVTGNNFSNAHIGGKVKREDRATGILLEGTSDIAITGNVFTGLAEEAIKSKGDCERIVVVGNVMSECSRSAPGEHPPLDVIATDSAISHNVIKIKPPANQ